MSAPVLAMAELPRYATMIAFNFQEPASQAVRTAAALLAGAS